MNIFKRIFSLFKPSLRLKAVNQEKLRLDPPVEKCYLVSCWDKWGKLIGSKYYYAVDGRAAVNLAASDVFWQSYTYPPDVYSFSEQLASQTGDFTIVDIGKNSIGLATQETLATMAKESGGNLEDLASVDFATEGTLESVEDNTSRSANIYYRSSDATALTGGWDAYIFGFSSPARSIALYNDDLSRYIQFSFDGGSTVHGKLLPGEGIVMDWISQTQIHLKGQTGAELYRLIVM